MGCRGAQPTAHRRGPSQKQGQRLRSDKGHSGLGLPTHCPGPVIGLGTPAREQDVGKYVLGVSFAGIVGKHASS